LTPHFSTLSLHDALPISIYYNSSYPHGQVLPLPLIPLLYWQPRPPSYLQMSIVTPLLYPLYYLDYPLYIDSQRCEGYLIFSATRSEEHTSELQSRENLVC